MSDIEELERRLASAMERIANGLGALGADADAGSAHGALEEERLVNAQLQERVRKLSERLGAAQDETRGRLETLDLELQRLRKSNEQLRMSNAALRQANEAGVGEPHLINKAMLAELEALRAERAADAAEVATIMGALQELLTDEDSTTGEAAHA